MQNPNSQKGWFKKGNIPKHVIKKGQKLALGHKQTLEHKRKMSESHKGNKNHNWRGGITEVHQLLRKQLEYRVWRKAVFERDDWKCKKCGEFENLRAHHIKNFSKYPELMFAIDNGITFCEDCHKLFHKIFGKIHNTPEQILKFLS